MKTIGILLGNTERALWLVGVFCLVFPGKVLLADNSSPLNHFFNTDSVATGDARPMLPSTGGSVTPRRSDIGDHQATESGFHPWYENQAEGGTPKGETEAIWPVRLRSIGNTNASFQDYGTGAYFHHGIDIRADGGSRVVAAMGGKVINIRKYGATDLYWEIAIRDKNGYVWQYHHVKKSSIPKSVYAALKSGSPIAQGATLGTVAIWPESSMGERYDHVHINVIGRNGVYLNPLAFLPKLPDRTPPKVNGIGIIQNGKLVKASSVRGSYTLAADVGDYIIGSRHKVPPHRIAYSIDGKDWKDVWSFDSLPGGASRTKYVKNFYIPGMTYGASGPKRFVVNLGFGPGGMKFPTSRGKHTIEVFVQDFAGNESSRKFSWTVR